VILGGGTGSTIAAVEPTFDSQPEAYVAYQQMPTRITWGWTETRVHKSFVIRTRSASKTLMQDVRRTISELAPESSALVTFDLL
jgi:hypothetical protein